MIKKDEIKIVKTQNSYSRLGVFFKIMSPFIEAKRKQINLICNECFQTKRQLIKIEPI
jgi:hypothetical protein